MTKPDSPLALSEVLETEDHIPVGSPDLGRLQKLQERTLRNDTSLLDRYHQLPLYGRVREKALTDPSRKARWRIDGIDSDHPLVQTILALRKDEEELMELPDEAMEPKERWKLRLAIKSKMSDLLIALQKVNDRVYDEVVQVLDHNQRQTEHADKMAHLSGKKDEDASDAEILAKAQKLGVKVNE